MGRPIQTLPGERPCSADRGESVSWQHSLAELVARQTHDQVHRAAHLLVRQATVFGGYVGGEVVDQGASRFRTHVVVDEQPDVVVDDLGGGSRAVRAEVTGDVDE